MALVNISKSDESRNEIKNKDGLAAILQAIYRPSTGFFVVVVVIVLSFIFDKTKIHKTLLRKYAIPSPSFVD